MKSKEEILNAYADYPSQFDCPDVVIEFNDGLLSMDEYAQSLAKEVISDLRSEIQVFTEGEAAIKSYAINLIKQKFDLK